MVLCCLLQPLCMLALPGKKWITAVVQVLTVTSPIAVGVFLSPVGPSGILKARTLSHDHKRKCLM